MAEEQPEVGDRIQVYWPDDDAHYVGRVTAYCETTSRYRVEYADGDVELLELGKERWRKLRSNCERFGDMLQAATGMRKSAPASPVSVIAEVKCDCEQYLVAHYVTNWLCDETRRPQRPVHPEMRDKWASLCANLCMQYVRDWLCEESIEVCDIELERTMWIFDMGDAKVLQAALNIYKNWKRPLTKYEWDIEVRIMKDIARRLSCAPSRDQSQRGRGVTYNARLLAEAAIGFNS